MPIDQFKSSLAVVIGIDAYGGGIPPLTTAVNDATRLAELLRAEHGYETLPADRASHRPAASRRERLRTLFTEELPARLGNDDRLLVYFAVYAREHNLGAPVTPEFSAGGFRARGYVAGVVFAPLANVADVAHALW